jgi:hypothetical protein
MLYRTLGKTGEKVSILGFGCMRLPIINGNMAQIDKEMASDMILKAIDSGINYIDTAWSYHSQVMGQKGESEPFVGQILSNGYREKVKIATKLPSWLITSRADMDRILDEQLQRLQTNHIDFYLVHSLNDALWKGVKKHEIFDFMDNALEDGRIKHAGFSFHDSLNLFKEIVDSYPWEFCQIQYNYLDEHYQAGKDGLEYAAEKGLGVVGMEPLRGGKLARTLPDDVLRILIESGINEKPAAMALRWIWDHEEFGTVLSGMNSMAEVAENIETAANAYASSMKLNELNAIERIKRFFQHRKQVDCSTCSYCMPCPSGVNIPGNFSYYNEYHLFDKKSQQEATTKFYHLFIKPEEKASACTECGRCEEKCPQGIKIVDELKNVTRLFEKSR